MNIGLIFITLFINPITNLLVGIYHLLLISHIPYPLGFSIILLTVLIRFILYPFTSQQIKSAHKMQKVAPHLAALKEKHKDDKKRHQEEMMKLYKEHGINPAAGCVPLIIQLPIIWSLYNVLNHIVSTNIKTTLLNINSSLYFPFLKLSQNQWDIHFFGILLTSSPAKLIPQNPLFLAIPVTTAVLQFFLSKMMMPEKQALTGIVPAKKDSSQPKKQDDFQTAFQNQSLFIFPVMIGFFSYNLPLGLSLYWNTFTVFGILQQYVLVGSGAAKPWLQKVGINGK